MEWCINNLAAFSDFTDFRIITLFLVIIVSFIQGCCSQPQISKRPRCKPHQYYDDVPQYCVSCFHICCPPYWYPSCPDKCSKFDVTAGCNHTVTSGIHAGVQGDTKAGSSGSYMWVIPTVLVLICFTVPVIYQYRKYRKRRTTTQQDQLRVGEDPAIENSQTVLVPNGNTPHTTYNPYCSGEERYQMLDHETEEDPAIENSITVLEMAPNDKIARQSTYGSGEERSQMIPPRQLQTAEEGKCTTAEEGKCTASIDFSMSRQIGSQNNPQQCTCVHTGIYLTDWNTATDLTVLKKLGITHAIGYLNNKEQKKFDYKLKPILDDDSIDYEIKTAEDDPDHDISQHFQYAIDKFMEVKCKNGKLLLHCNMGMNRSAAVAAAIIIQEKGGNIENRAEEVIKEMRKKRYVLTNKAFVKKVKLFKLQVDS